MRIFLICLPLKTERFFGLLDRWYAGEYWNIGEMLFFKPSTFFRKTSI